MSGCLVTLLTIFSRFQVKLLQVDNDVATVTEWSGDFWQLSMETHLRIMELLDLDDPDLETLFLHLRGRQLPPSSVPRQSRGRGRESRGAIRPVTISSVAQIPADALQLDVYNLVRSRNDTPGFAIKSTYYTID